LFRDCYDPNIEEELILECEIHIINKKLKIQSIRHSGISFFINDIDKNVYDKFPFLFSTKEAAKQQYDKEFELWKSRLLSYTKQSMVNSLLQIWIGSHIQPLREIEVIKDKIEEEFGVRPK